MRRICPKFGRIDFYLLSLQVIQTKAVEMKSSFAKYVLLCLAVVGFAACEVEFDPNEDWKQVTVIHGLLDSDDDTTFVRVQKGFLGSGDYFRFAKERDSIYYREDEVDVFMVSYYPWEPQVIRDTFWFSYTENYSKPEGDFYSEKAPIYYCVTKDRLSGVEELKKEYRIVVRNRQSGETAYASTRLIGNYDILSPTPQMVFQSSGNRKVMPCSWNNLSTASASARDYMAAKMYQPVMRFFYQLDGVETYVDVELGYRINTHAEPGFVFNYNIYMNDIVDGIKLKLKDQKGRCSWTHRSIAFELYINSCSLEMYEYYSNSRQEENTLTDKPIYTNVTNGYGLFASRRRHIKLNFARNNNDLVTAIAALGYGFESR